MLELQNLTVKYGAVAAVRNISLSLPQGTLSVINGQLGSGKSSLLQAIFGMIPFNGTIRLNNRKIATVNPKAMVKHGVAFMPEGGPVFEKMSLRENLNLVLPRAAETEELSSAFEIFPSIKRYLDSPAYALSGGQRQMLSFLRMVLAKPHMLLLDEPTAGLAKDAVESISKKLTELAQSGATILVAEQTSTLYQIADQKFQMKNGHLNVAEEEI